MYPITHSQVAFLSGGKNIRLDCFHPSSNGKPFPAVIALHGSGGGHASMSQPATMLASQGFAVYVLHYFDRTGTINAEKQNLFRNFPLWMKTLWDAVSHVERQHQIDPERIGLLGFSLGAYLSLSNAGIDPRVRAVVEFFGGLPKEMKLFLQNCRRSHRAHFPPLVFSVRDVLAGGPAGTGALSVHLAAIAAVSVGGDRSPRRSGAVFGGHNAASAPVERAIQNLEFRSLVSGSACVTKLTRPP